MCPISFNIYGMKLNEVHFSSGTVITPFLDKPYQEINFKRKTRKTTVRFTYVQFYFTLLDCVHFYNEIE